MSDLFLAFMLLQGLVAFAAIGPVFNAISERIARRQTDGGVA